jgi:hypothetical protein
MYTGKLNESNAILLAFLAKTEAKRGFGFFTYMNRQYTQNYLHNLKAQK